MERRWQSDTGVSPNTVSISARAVENQLSLQIATGLPRNAPASWSAAALRRFRSRTRLLASSKVGSPDTSCCERRFSSSPLPQSKVFARSYLSERRSLDVRRSPFHSKAAVGRRTPRRWRDRQAPFALPLRPKLTVLGVSPVLCVHPRFGAQARRLCHSPRRWRAAQNSQRKSAGFLLGTPDGTECHPYRPRAA